MESQRWDTKHAEVSVILIYNLPSWMKVFVDVHTLNFWAIALSSVELLFSFGWSLPLSRELKETVGPAIAKDFGLISLPCPTRVRRLKPSSWWPRFQKLWNKDCAMMERNFTAKSSFTVLVFQPMASDLIFQAVRYFRRCRTDLAASKWRIDHHGMDLIIEAIFVIVLLYFETGVASPQPEAMLIYYAGTWDTESLLHGSWCFRFPGNEWHRWIFRSSK